MSQTPPAARWIVAIPARNEAQRLPGALAALDVAAHRASAEVRALVLANGCDDATAAVAGSQALRHLRLEVRDVTLPPGLAHAGGARRAVVHAARAAFGRQPADLLLTTDADCRLAPDALVRAEAAFADGADLVLARIVCAPDPWDPSDEVAVAWGTPGVLWRHKVRQLVETLATGRPASDDVHDDYGAAGIAIRPDAYACLGGFAAVPCDEDRMLVAGADQAGLAVNRSSGMTVTALTRRTGRAVGGMACAIARNEALARAGAPQLVEHHEATLARLLAAPSHANAFTADVHDWEDATAAIAALDAVIEGYRTRSAA